MSVLIKNMNMPKSCEDCPCAYFTEGVHHDFCQALGYDSEIKYGSEWKLDNCPLVPVPKHGRLIDADAIPYNKIMLVNDDFYYGTTKPYIDRMPTIIRAEGGE